MNDTDTRPDLAVAQGDLQRYRQRIDGLLLYGGVFHTPVGEAFLALLTALTSGDVGPSLRAYGIWFQALVPAIVNRPIGVFGAQLGILLKMEFQP